MIYGSLSHWKHHILFNSNLIWREAFEWIEKHSEDAADGFYPLSLENFYVRVMEYETKQREEANYESHLHTIDLQYTILGAEGIEVEDAAKLVTRGDYQVSKDVQFYNLPVRSSVRVDNLKDRFCILFPHDAHLPQLLVPGYTRVRKLVVKIPCVLVS
ncbi:MAG: YhcH/YjgK/YiaL family protein [Thiocapsa sp.]|uniref:YhcH/YjgK/YiaL family protein n=1 Tax=Thiocapsa sp. TaxID=2024551 RepID=UPI001BCDFB70|nr:MAG: YhcH/YjgK/YiaL family protein [Thiocapsa sp.]